jgi:hypothetical protein
MNFDAVNRYDGVTGTFIDTFASGGGLDWPGGLAFGWDGNLYVSSRQTDQILRYNGKTGDFIDVFASGGGLTDPYGLEFGPDGNLYVAGITASAIFRYDGCSGAFMDVFAAGGGLVYPRDLEFGPDGNLYVPGVLSNQVHRYDGATGAFIDAFITVPGTVGLEGLAFGPDDHLYLAAPAIDEVHKYDGSSGAFIEVFASGGGLNVPFFMIFNPAEPTTMLPTAYCTSKTNSQGCLASAGSVGTPSVSGGPFAITCDQVVNNKAGILYYGYAQKCAPYQGGWHCVQAPLRRTPLQGSSGNPPPNDCSGTYTYDFGARIQSGIDPALVAGAPVYAQWWYRDPTEPTGFTTCRSDALRFTITP